MNVRVVREQSHKDEMAAALRGDFERLRARGVATTLAREEPPPDVVARDTPTRPAESQPDPRQESRMRRLFRRA